MSSAIPYPLSPPTFDDMRRSLSRAVGAADAEKALELALARLGLTEDEVVGCVRKLTLLADEFAHDDGLISVIGLSLRIRCETYLAVGTPVVH